MSDHPPISPHTHTFCNLLYCSCWIHLGLHWLLWWRWRRSVIIRASCPQDSACSLDSILVMSKYCWLALINGRLHHQNGERCWVTIYNLFDWIVHHKKHGHSLQIWLTNTGLKSSLSARCINKMNPNIALILLESPSYIKLVLSFMQAHTARASLPWFCANQAIQDKQESGILTGRTPGIKFKTLKINIKPGLSLDR